MIGAMLAALLVAIAMIDARTMRIPDVLNLMVFALGCLAVVVVKHLTPSWALVSTMVGATVMWLVRWGYQQLRGRQGLGLGDVKFIGAAGPWVGIEGFAPMILIAAIAALLWLGIDRATRDPVGRWTVVPFGPFLALGLFIVWLRDCFVGSL